MIKKNKFDGDPSYPCADVSLETDKNEGGFEHERVVRGEVGMTWIQHSMYHQPRLELSLRLHFAEWYRSRTFYPFIFDVGSKSSNLRLFTRVTVMDLRESLFFL